MQVEVTRDEAIGFIEHACRNWKRIPPLDNDDIEDMRVALQRHRIEATRALEAENAALRGLLVGFVAWVERADDDEDDCEYLNGDGWDDIRRIYAEARSLQHKEPQG